MTETMREFYELDTLIDICMAEYRVSRDIKHLEEALTYIHLLRTATDKIDNR